MNTSTNTSFTLNSIQAFKSKSPKRLGRGIGSTTGKTCGKGHKGQKARSGSGRKLRLGFIGGQTPLQRTIPKMGFKSLKNKFLVSIPVSRLNILLRNDITEVSMEALRKCGLIGKKHTAVKLIGDSAASVQDLSYLAKLTICSHDSRVIRLSASISSLIKGYSS